MSVRDQIFPFVALISLAVLADLSASPHHTGPIYAVFHNETSSQVKVRIQAQAGYSVFGVAPGGVHTEEIPRGSSILVTTTANRKVASLNNVPFREPKTNFDNAHRAYFYRITGKAITSVAPRDANGWWALGLPH